MAAPTIFPKAKHRLPDENTLVSEIEQFTTAASGRYASDVGALRQALLGREGRPYRHHPAGEKDLQELYAMLRESDDPAQWAKVLQLGEPTSILQWMQQAEAAYQETQHGGSAARAY